MELERKGMFMCAIAGLVGLPIDPETEKKMEASMRRRGPDESGVLHTQLCCLIHRRLSIIDPSGGKQPMQLHAEGEIFTIVLTPHFFFKSETLGEATSTINTKSELTSLT